MIEVKEPALRANALGVLSTLQDHLDFSKYAKNRQLWREAGRLAHPLIRLWDGDYNYRGTVAGERNIDFEFIENEVGTATIELPLDHYLAKWVMSYRGRAKRNVHVTIDKQGARWSGRMEYYKVVKDEYGDCYLEVFFLHDFEQLKYILGWANPFLMASVAQFPKVWVVFGPAKWSLLLTLAVNVMRLETSLWTLPDNPLDPKEWMNFNVMTWRNVVKPFPFIADNTPIDIVFTRFQSMFEIASKILATNQLTMTCRRYIKGEDPHPFSDLKGELNVNLVEDLLSVIPLRNGCLVWDIEDNSGYESETSFGGSLLTGLVRSVVNIGSDGTTEGVNVFRGEPTYPGEYWEPGFLGTKPRAPWVIMREGPLTGIKSSEFKYIEAKATSYVVGGESVPGLNEAISCGVNAGGDILSAVINSALEAASGAPVGAIPVEMPSLGGIIDAVAKMLYLNTFAAWMEIPTLRAAALELPLGGLETKKTSLGDFHLYEKRAGSTMKAFTASAFLAARAEQWKERAHTEHTIEISDAAPYYFGEAPHGHYGVGDRIGVTVFGYPDKDAIFVERVKKAKWSCGPDGPTGWVLELGYSEQADPVLKAFEKIRDLTQIGNEIGLF